MKFILFAISMFSITSCGFTDVDKPQPKCVADFCLDSTISSLPTFADFQKRFEIVAPAFEILQERRKACFVYESGNAEKVYVDLVLINVKSQYRIIGMGFSFIPHCGNSQSLSNVLELYLDNGISLNSNDYDLIENYGQPTYLLRPPPKEVVKYHFPMNSAEDVDTIYQYVNNENNVTSLFFIKNGKVVGINVTADE